MDGSSVISSARLAHAREEILKVAPASEDAAKRADDLIKDAEGVTGSIGKNVIAELASEGKLRRVGTGRRNDAYKYWSPELLDTTASSGEGGIQSQDQDLGASPDVSSIGSSTGSGIITSLARAIAEARARSRASFPGITDRVVKIVGFLGVLGGLVFAIVYIVNTLDPCIFKDCPEDKPVVTSVSPTEVSPGQEADITGKNLGKISEAHLTTGVIDERIFLLPISDTRLIVNVPKGIAPAGYKLELKIEGKDSRLPAGTLEVIEKGTTPISNNGKKPTIVFANLNWDSARVQNAIARFIVEKGYGYKTDSIPELPGNAEDVWKSLVIGSILVNMEVWLPNLREEWETALENGSVIPLGKSLDLTWQSAFVVPTYMIQGNPGSAPELRTVQDLRQYAEVFAKPGSNGKAVLWNCLEEWKCAKINEKQVSAYGLADVIQLRDPGSDEELFNKVLLANESKTPWLGYMWGPTIVTSNVDLTLLEQPTCDVGQNPEEGCGYDASRVRIAVHPSMVSAAPDIVELLRKWDFKESTQFVAEDCFKQTNKDFEKTAVCYLNNEQAVWAQWMPPEVSQRVREALPKQ